MPTIDDQTLLRVVQAIVDPDPAADLGYHSGAGRAMECRNLNDRSENILCSW
jgi:hypothetical protein